MYQIQKLKSLKGIQLVKTYIRDVMFFLFKGVTNQTYWY